MRIQLHDQDGLIVRYGEVPLETLEKWPLIIYEGSYYVKKKSNQYHQVRSRTLKGLYRRPVRH